MKLEDEWDIDYFNLVNEEWEKRERQNLEKGRLVRESKKYVRWARQAIKNNEAVEELLGWLKERPSDNSR